MFCLSNIHTIEASFIPSVKDFHVIAEQQNEFVEVFLIEKLADRYYGYLRSARGDNSWV